MPATQRNRPLTYMSNHSRHLSQPSIISSQAVSRGGRGGSVSVGSYAGVPQPTPVVSRVASESVSVIPLTMSSSLAHQLPPDQISGHIHSNFSRRSSEPNSLRVANTERAFLAPYVPENQPTPAMYTPFFGHPNFSQASPSVQYPTAASTHMVPEWSSHTQDDLLAFWDSDGSFTPSCAASDLQDDSISVTSFTESASADVQYEFVDNALPQHGTSSSAAPQPQLSQTQLRSGKRKRDAPQKDPRAAKRLRSQRQSDEENFKELWQLVAPDGAENVPKKDRLATSASQASYISWMLNSVFSSPLYEKEIGDSGWLSATGDDYR